MQVGKPFNPYGMFVGVFIPNVLLESGALSPTAMLLWARMAQFAGKGGRCYPKQTTLAKSLHITTGRVKQLVKELEEKQFIRICKPDGQARLFHAPNEYEFLWHQSLEQRETVPPEVEYIIPPGGEHIIPPREESQREEKPLKGTQPTVRTFTDRFCRLWQGQYNTKYPFAQKDGVCAGKIWKLVDRNWQTAERVLQNYFADHSEFFKGHSLGKLLSQLPSFLLKEVKSSAKDEKLPDFLVNADKTLRLCATRKGGKYNTKQLIQVVMQHRVWLKNVRQTTEGLYKESAELNMTLDIRRGFLAFVKILTVVRYVDWIVDEIASWEHWGGNLDSFLKDAKHWHRYLDRELREYAWTPNKAERKVMDEA